MNESVESPVIKLPEGEALRARLSKKLEEYKDRVVEVQGVSHPAFAHLANFEYRDAFYKQAVLEKLLADGEVNCWDLSRKLSPKNPNDSIDVMIFGNACGVIECYCTGRINATWGGTGLPDN
ncbi:hypothetical protein IIB51_01615 [Patescibacteria group bacterium]|nr:hypothetical protein [Patescibacteria group bacterium]